MVILVLAIMLMAVAIAFLVGSLRGQSKTIADLKTQIKELETQVFCLTVDDDIVSSVLIALNVKVYNPDDDDKSIPQRNKKFKIHHKDKDTTLSYMIIGHEKVWVERFSEVDMDNVHDHSMIATIADPASMEVMKEWLSK